LPTGTTSHIHDAAGEILCRRAFDRSLEWDADLPSDLVERIWSRPHVLLAEGEKLQDKLRCTVARIEHSGGIFTWKHHNWGTLRRTVKKSLAESPARKSWQDSGYLRAAGIPTPRIRAVYEYHFGPFQHCSYLLSDYIVGTSLYRLMRFEKPSADLVAHLAQQVGDIWQQLDELGVWHNDFKTENFLVDRAGKVWLIDFERMRRFAECDRERMRERQMKDARDFLHPRNWRSDPAAAEVFRQAILATPAAKQTLAGSLATKHPLSKPTRSTNRPNHLVTVLIPCRNAAESIVGCLESVRDMADEILVADYGSTDGTLDRVRRFGGCRIIESTNDVGAGDPAEDPVDFVARAAGQASHEWILRLRPDEQLNGELSRQVQDLLATEPTQDGFQIARTVYLRGRRLRYGDFRREPSIRLFRKQQTQFELCDGRVEACIPTGKIGMIKSRLVYEACPSIERCIEEMMRAATRAAHDVRHDGPRASRRRWVWRVPLRFFRSYVLRSGWLDGWVGLNASFLSALSVYLQEAIHWEIARPPFERRSLVHDSLKQLKVFAPEEQAESPLASDSEAIRSAA
jgi:Lipopolysaccharide kinase (Kdo/WaaP) family/Glycosyl transferase family 2